MERGERKGKGRKSRSATQTLFKSSKALLYFGERISLLGISFSSSYYPGSAVGLRGTNNVVQGMITECKYRIEFLNGNATRFLEAKYRLKSSNLRNNGSIRRRSIVEFYFYAK